MELTKNITLGVYIPGSSVLHRLDPRTKIISLTCLIILLMFMREYSTFGVTGILLIILLITSKLPVRFFLCGFKPMLPVLIMMWLFQFFLYKPLGADLLFSWWLISATDAGLHMANMIVLRVLLLFSAITFLTLTTSLVSLTDGMESLLNPLRHIGLPVHELVMTMVIALRFVSILAEELDKIIKAQMARGVAFDQGNFWNKTGKLFPVLLPLFISAFNRAEELIVAMEARNYRGGRERTKMKALHWGRADFFALILLSMFSSLIIFLSIKT